MVNEWAEFQHFIRTPEYAPCGKNEFTYLGRFTFEMLLELSGFAYVLELIARGYLFHERDGALLQGNPRERLQYARRALCAWSSSPRTIEPDPKDEWKAKPDFPELHVEFPELVDDSGGGWLYRHVHGIIEYVEANPERVRATTLKKCQALQAEFDKRWQKKVVQAQVPLFAPTTNKQWLLSFDTALAAALEAGPLRMDDVTLPDELLERLEARRPKKEIEKAEVIPALVAYYAANRRADTDWVQLPVVNFGAYFGTTSFSKKYLYNIPTDIMVRSDQNSGVCRYRILPEYLPETFQPSGA